jgi:hypothetical protein
MDNMGMEDAPHLLEAVSGCHRDRAIAIYLNNECCANQLGKETKVFFDHAQAQQSSIKRVAKRQFNFVPNKPVWDHRLAHFRRLDWQK